MVEAFTYEDIYELLRSEKFASDLEEIKPEDLARIKIYLQSKRELLKKQANSTDILSSQRKIKIQQEIDNAVRVLKDLYEVRERKIINRALYSVRTGSQFKDTTNMLKNEIKLYENLLKVLKNQKQEFFKLIENSSDKEEETAKHKGQKEIRKIRVKFLEACPAVFGEDLEKYGPFKEGDEADIPEQLCSILEKQKKVERKVNAQLAKSI